MTAENSPPATADRGLVPGESLPWFQAALLGGTKQLHFDRMAGRHNLMLFFGTTQVPGAIDAIALARRHRAMFDDVKCSFVGVTVDPRATADEAIKSELPGMRYLHDLDRRISTLFGAWVPKGHRPIWVLLDPTLRVIRVFPLKEGKEAIALLKKEIQAIPDDQWAPVLCVPRVFEPELCRQLIEGYEADGGTESGLVHDVGGKSVVSIDSTFKQRRDWVISDSRLCAALSARIGRRLAVPVERAFQFLPTRVERYMVSCYEAGHGHFQAHRDNTSKSTEHRRFAVTINLNDGYEGGDLRFPEFGQRTYRAPPGGAIVFSCSLLHEATPVTSGKRYVFIPFLFDEAGQEIRKANRAGAKANAPQVEA